MRLERIRNFIINELNSKSLGDCYYHHGAEHSLVVEKACISICESEKGLRDIDVELLRIAALTHDIGHAETMVGHEIVGCNFVLKFMPKYGYIDSEVARVRELILATKFPHNPVTLLENIICDADLSYLGNGDYHTQANKLKKELIELHKYEFDDEEKWLKYQVDFLEKHSFFTNFAKENYNPKKKKIIKELKKKLTLLK
jgi:putative nucleotidyltransferase with HDIG domain